MLFDQKLENLEGIDEKFHNLFVKGEDGYTFDLSKIKTEQDVNNVLDAKAKEKEARKQAQEEKRQLQERLQELESKLAETKFSGNDEELQKRLENALQVKIKPYQDKENQYQTKIGELESKLNEFETASINTKLKDKIYNEINKQESTISPLAFEDIYSRALRSDIGLTYNKELDEFVDKENRIFNDWLISQSTEAKHWQKPSLSAGATGGKGSGVKENPFKNGNLAEQTRLYRENRDLYEKYKKEYLNK